MSKKAIALYFSNEDAQSEGVSLTVESANGIILLFVETLVGTQSFDINLMQAAKLCKALRYAIDAQLEAIQDIFISE